MATYIILLFWVTAAGEASTLAVRFPSAEACEAKRTASHEWLPGAVGEPIKAMAVSECLRLHPPGKPA